ncbi:MAG: hypothetical protein AAF366_17030 [Pseudomonadota bacterium]
MTTRRSVLTLLAGSALAACQPTAPVVVTRDAPDPFEGGIGGTGIVGVLTDFGSLIVNGLRVELTTGTTIATPFGRVTEGALVPGQALTIVANRSADRLVARHVRIDHALVGTVAPDLTVNGVPVRPEAGAVGRLIPGQRVAISGLWAGVGVSASRIDPADTLADPLDAAAPDIVAGVAGTGGPTGRILGGQPVQLPDGVAASGDYVAARGRYSDGVLTASITRRGRFVTGAASLRQLSVEGYLEPVSAAPGFRVAGLGHSFGRQLDLAPLARSRAAYFGRYDGLFQAATGYVLPDSFAARRRLLLDGFQGGQEGQVVRL